MHLVRQRHLFECDADFSAVGGVKGIQRR
jgi:hypothetical protein